MKQFIIFLGIIFLGLAAAYFNTDQSKSSFFRCDWGNSTSEANIAEQLKEFFINDEIIKFQQQGQPTCAFTSFASMLFMKGHVRESEEFLSTIDINQARLVPGKPNALLSYIAAFSIVTIKYSNV